MTGTTLVHAERAQLLPADFELIDRGHVGHRAAGGQVGQDDLLVRRAEDVGALGHEVDAAEDDEVGGVLAGGELRELQRVAGVVGELDDLVALVVVAEDDEAVAERGLGGGDADVQLGVRQTEIGLRQRLALAEPRPFVVGQDGRYASSSTSELVKYFSISNDEKCQIPFGPSRPPAIAGSGLDLRSSLQRNPAGFQWPAAGVRHKARGDWPKAARRSDRPKA